MQSIQTLSTSQTNSHPLAVQIPRLSHKKAGLLAAAELDRFISLVESLEGDDSDGFVLELTGPAGGVWQFGEETPFGVFSWLFST